MVFKDLHAVFLIFVRTLSKWYKRSISLVLCTVNVESAPLLKFFLTE